MGKKHKNQDNLDETSDDSVKGNSKREFITDQIIYEKTRYQFRALFRKNLTL